MCLAANDWARVPRVYDANTRADAAAVGFDDASISRQVPLPLGERALAMAPHLREEARAALREWSPVPAGQYVPRTPKIHADP